MMKKQKVPGKFALIEKEVLFMGIARLYLLLNDIDDGGEEEVVFADESSETDDENEDDADVDAGDAPPTHFQDFRANLVNLEVSMFNEYMGLFALFTEPLEKDPELKKEFVAYAREHYQLEIEYEAGSTAAPRTPKLSIVPRTDQEGVPPKDPPKKK